MAIVSIVTERDNVELDSFISKLKDKLDNKNILLNPFKTMLKVIDVNYPEKEVNQLILLYINPLYPNVTIFGWVVAFGVYYAFGWNIICLIAIIIGLLGLFWSKYFYTLIFYLGLKKAKYLGKFKMISYSKVLELILNQ